MGLGNSLPQTDLVQGYRPEEWSIYNRTIQYELWQHRQTGRRFMAYPLDLQQDPHLAINIYEFRRMHSLELIAPEVILKTNKDYVCVQENSYYLLIEYIPVNLSHINPRLNIQERFSILAIIFSALHTLSYRYGPVFLTETMINLTEKGRIKIWVNDRLSLNIPSFMTRTPSETNMVASRHHKDVRTTFHCISQVFRILSNWKTDTFPLDFREEAVTLCTFEESEQFVISYCKKNDIRLLKKIDYERYVEKKQQINLISADPDNFEMKKNTRRDRSATTLNRHTPPSSLAPTPKNQDKVTVLESVIHVNSKQLFANYEALNDQNHPKQKIPMIASKHRRFEGQNEPRVRVYAPIEEDGGEFSFQDLNSRPSSPTNRDNTRASPSFGNKANLPPRSPNRNQPLPANPGIRFKSPQASIDYDPIQRNHNEKRFEKKQNYFQVVNSIPKQYQVHHQPQAQWQDNWYPQPQRPPLQFPQPQVRYSQPPQYYSQPSSQYQHQEQAQYQHQQPNEYQSQNYSRNISYLPPKFTHQPIPQAYPQFHPEKIISNHVTQPSPREPFRDQAVEPNGSLLSAGRKDLSFNHEPAQPNQSFLSDHASFRQSNPPSHHTTFLAEKSIQQINELDESSLVLFSHDRSGFQDDTVGSARLPYNPHNISQAEAYLKGKYAQYLTKQPQKQSLPQDRGQQLFQKYIRK